MAAATQGASLGQLFITDHLHSFLERRNKKVFRNSKKKKRNSQQISQEGSPGLARLCPHHGGTLNHIHGATSSGARPRPWLCLCREDEEAAISGDKELRVSCTHGPCLGLRIRNQPQSPPLSLLVPVLETKSHLVEQWSRGERQTSETSDVKEPSQHSTPSFHHSYRGSLTAAAPGLHSLLHQL